LSSQAWKQLANFSKLLPSQIYEAVSGSLAAKCRSLSGGFGNQLVQSGLGAAGHLFQNAPNPILCGCVWKPGCKMQLLIGRLWKSTCPGRLGSSWSFFPNCSQANSMRLCLGAWLQNAAPYQDALEINLSSQAWKQLANFSKMLPSQLHKAGSGSLAAKCSSLSGGFGNQFVQPGLGGAGQLFQNVPKQIVRGCGWVGLGWLGSAGHALACSGLAWLGWLWAGLGLAWVGMGLAWIGLGWLGSAWHALACSGLAWLGWLWARLLRKASKTSLKWKSVHRAGEARKITLKA